MTIIKKLSFVTLFSLLSFQSALAAPTPKDDCEQLLSAVEPFAEKMLKKYGEFYPYGGAMKPNGEIVYVAGYEGTEHPLSNDVINLIKSGFVQAATDGTYKATAIVYDVRVTLPSSNLKSDAIAVSLDHKDKFSVVVYFPYQLRNGTLNVSESFTSQGSQEIF